VNDDNRVVPRPVKTGAIQDGQWLVSEGLKAGDRVVVEGFQKFASGDKVSPRPWMEASAVGETTVAAQPPAARQR
jgi:membrane fusion protein (multidrug efflux system)